MISKEDEKRKKRFNAREVRMVYISRVGFRTKTVKLRPLKPLPGTPFELLPRTCV
jgi:hypothetical protein